MLIMSQWFSVTRENILFSSLLSEERQGRTRGEGGVRVANAKCLPQGTESYGEMRNALRAVKEGIEASGLHFQ